MSIIRIDLERLALLIRGREGEELPGCCGRRELHVVEPTSDECKYIRENIGEIIQVHGCEGKISDLSGQSFDFKKCQCIRNIEYRSLEPEKCCRHGKYAVEKIRFWGCLMESDYTIHADVLRSILDGLGQLPEILDHCAKHHLFRCLVKLHTGHNRFRMIWDFLKENFPQDFTEFKCCSNKCCRLENSSYDGVRLIPIPILEMYSYGDAKCLKNSEHYIEDYFEHRRGLGIIRPIEVHEVKDAHSDDETIKYIERSSHENKIDVIEVNPLCMSIANKSIRCVELFALDNPDLLKVYNYCYTGNRNGDYVYKPIIHYTLTINSDACSIERQRETVEILQQLIRLGADISAPTIINGVKIPLGDFLESYRYNYPGSPVYEFFKKLGHDIAYDSSEEVKNALATINSYHEPQRDIGRVFKYLRQHTQVKDPNLFEKIAREALDMYRVDYIAAGGKYPYYVYPSVGIDDAQPIKSVLDGIYDKSSPDEISQRLEFQ